MLNTYRDDIHFNSGVIFLSPLNQKEMRIQKTVNPDKRLDFNKWSKHVRTELLKSVKQNRK